MPRRIIKIQYFIPPEDRPIDFSDKSNWKEISEIDVYPKPEENSWVKRANDIIIEMGYKHHSKKEEENWKQKLYEYEV